MKKGKQNHQMAIITKASFINQKEVMKLNFQIIHCLLKIQKNLAIIELKRNLQILKLQVIIAQKVKFIVMAIVAFHYS
jgi:hypothetical protein